MPNQQLVEFYNWSNKNKTYLIIGTVVFIAALVLFTEQVKAFFLISILGVVATFSYFYKRVYQAPPVLELVTLNTVLVSLLYGPVVGAIFTLIVSITSEVASQAFDPFSITYIPPRVAVAFAAPFLVHKFDVDFGLLGLLMAILYNLLQQPVYLALTDVEKRIKSLYFSSLNIPLNFLVFKFLGEPLLHLLQRIA